MSSLFDRPPTPVNMCTNDPVNGKRPALSTMADASVAASASVGGGHTLLDALSSGLHSHGNQKGNVAN